MVVFKLCWLCNGFGQMLCLFCCNKVMVFDLVLFESCCVVCQWFLKMCGIYLLLNVFMIVVLFCGFFVVVQVMNVCFEIVVIVIFVVMVFDGMDGCVVCMIYMQSVFGEQFDSLLDMVLFGVVFVFVMYEWVLKDLGCWGWFVVFVYCLGVVLCFVCFNMNIGVVDKCFFQGLLSLVVVVLIVGFVWFVIDNCVLMKFGWLLWVVFVLMIYVGVMMVLNVLFYSGKVFDVWYCVLFVVILFVVVVFVFVLFDLLLMLFCLFVLYGLFGYVFWVYQVICGCVNLVCLLQCDY